MIIINNRLLLFWKVGRNVTLRQKSLENAISKYSDLCAYHFGMSKTFSRENVHYMKRFYECFPIYISELNKLNWEHYLELLKISNLNERYFYLRVAIFCKSSVLELRDVINNNVYNTI